MLPIRLDLPRLMQVTAAGLSLLACAGPAPALAQAKLDARYTASLGGVTIGRGAWMIDFRDDQYTAAASGMATGLLKIFAGGTGTTRVTRQRRQWPAGAPELCRDHDRQ